MQRRGPATILVSLSLVALATTDELPLDLPEARCNSGSPSRGVDGRWAGVDTSVDVEPGEPGYAQVFEFLTLPDRSPGRAVVARLSNPSTGKELWQSESRTWAAVIKLSQSASAIAWEYADTQQPDYLLAFHPEARRVYRLSRGLGRHAVPQERICRLLGYSGLASNVEITGVASGRVTSRGAFRRHLSFFKGDR